MTANAEHVAVLRQIRRFVPGGEQQAALDFAIATLTAGAERPAVDEGSAKHWREDAHYWRGLALERRAALEEIIAIEDREWKPVRAFRSEEQVAKDEARHELAIEIAAIARQAIPADDDDDEGEDEALSAPVAGEPVAMIMAKVEGYELGRNQAADFAKATDPMLAQSIRLNWHSDLPPKCADCGGRGFQAGWVRTHEDDGYEVERDCPTCDSAGVMIQYGVADLTVKQLEAAGYSVHVEAAAPPAAPAPVGDTVRRNDDGTLDEIVGTGDYHLEQMHEGHWSLRLGRHLIGLHTKHRGTIHANFIENDLPPAALANASAHSQAFVMVPREKLRDWQFRAKREVRSGHRCDAVTFCDSIMQATTAMLAAAPGAAQGGGHG